MFYAIRIELIKIAEMWQFPFVFYFYHHFCLSHDPTKDKNDWITKVKREKSFLAGISSFQNESRKECCDAGFAMLSKFVEMPGLGQDGILDIL